MNLNVKYRPIKAFLLAVETGSFTQAAQRLGVTQPSFTALIRDLEAVLDVRLFERTTRRIALTAAGQEFLLRIRRPLADIEEAYRSIQDLTAARRGLIVLGALPSTALTLIPPALGLLRQAYPALQVRVVEAHNDELLSMLRTNQIEFALATLLEDAEDLSFEPLLQDVFCAVFPREHELAKRRSVSWRDLLAYDLILLSHGSSARAQFERAVQGEGQASARPSHYEVTNMTTAVRLVRRKMGITVLPRLAVPELNLQGLLVIALGDVSARRVIGLVRRKNRELSPASLAFIPQLNTVVGSLEKKLPPMRRS
jgi:DNA-binding transcriptional LysR family regulator